MAVVATLVAAGASAQNEASPDTPPAAAPTPETHTIAIMRGRFSPSHVDIALGDIIVWVNETDAPQSAWDMHDNFDTGMLDPGRTASFAFNTPGTFVYRSRPDGTMRASITISR